jgi:hypothetical protein
MRFSAPSRVKSVDSYRLILVSPLVRTEDLIDAHTVAEILGLAQANSVSLYQRRYPDMPRPVINLGPRRPMLWRRPISKLGPGLGGGDRELLRGVSDARFGHGVTPLSYDRRTKSR